MLWIILLLGISPVIKAGPITIDEETVNFQDPDSNCQTFCTHKRTKQQYCCVFKTDNQQDKFGTCPEKRCPASIKNAAHCSKDGDCPGVKKCCSFCDQLPVCKKPIEFKRNKNKRPGFSSADFNERPTPITFEENPIESSIGDTHLSGSQSTFGETHNQPSLTDGTIPIYDSQGNPISLHSNQGFNNQFSATGGQPFDTGHHVNPIGSQPSQGTKAQFPFLGGQPTTGQQQGTQNLQGLVGGIVNSIFNDVNNAGLFNRPSHHGNHQQQPSRTSIGFNFFRPGQNSRPFFSFH